MRDLWRRLITLFFKLLYGHMAWSYDLVAWVVSLGQWKNWVQQALPHITGSTVLELGHGPGHLQVALNRRGLTSVGLDLSPQMGRQAQRRLRKQDLDQRLVRARAQALPFRSDTFSDLVATFPTNYIADPATTAEAQRALSQEGKLIVVASVRLTGRGILPRLLEWLYRITGQREPISSDTKSPLQVPGWELTPKWVEVPRGQLLLLIGQPSEEPRPCDRT